MTYPEVQNRYLDDAADPLGMHIACHDIMPVTGHVELMTTASGLETCEVCHGAGSEFDVDTVPR